jgi:peptidoglycan/LPS O-acetylase OafA/YrhL
MKAVQTNRLKTVDALRGVASLAVCFSHLTYSIFGPDSWLKLVGGYGSFGVQIFFVISGFIIPYTLWRASYRPHNYGTFVLKRLIRLDPPYLVVVTLLIPIGYLSAHAPGYNGPPFHVTIPQVLLHLGYLNVFFGNNWLSGVFWTLAIEFQYYLLVGLFFPLISNRNPKLRLALFVCLGVLAVAIPMGTFIFHWFFIFMLGMLVFQRYVGLINNRYFFALLGLLGVGAWFTTSPLMAIIGVLTAMAISFVRFDNALFNFLGTISYSLYLIHEPVGRRVVNWGARFTTDFGEKILVLLIGLASAICAAWLLYWFIERPAQRWSSSITFGKKGESVHPLPVKPETATAEGSTI